MDGFEQAQPDHGRRQAGRDLRVGAHRAVAQVLDAVGGLHQRGGLAAIERHDHRRVIDLHAPFGRQAGHGEVLQLHAVDGFGQGGDFIRPQPRMATVRPFRNGQAQQQRHGVGPFQRIEARHRAAPVLGVTGLAGARVEHGPRPSEAWVDDGADTQSLRNRPLPTWNSWRRSKSMLAEGCENVGVDHLAGGGRAGLHGLEGLGLGEIAGGRGDGGDALQIPGREVIAHRRLRGGAGMDRRRQYGCQDALHLNTASGLSRLSEPSMAILPRSSSAITRSRLRVWSIRRSMAACTTALPSLLPSAIIWS